MCGCLKPVGVLLPALRKTRRTNGNRHGPRMDAEFYFRRIEVAIAWGAPGKRFQWIPAQVRCRWKDFRIGQTRKIGPPTVNGLPSQMAPVMGMSKHS